MISAGQKLPGINQNADQAQGIFKDAPQGSGTQRPRSRGVGAQHGEIRAQVSLEKFCREDSQGVISCLPSLSLNIPVRVDFTQVQQGQDQQGQDQQGQDPHGQILTPGRFGARVARDYKNGPGMNETRNNSVSPNFKYPSRESFESRIIRRISMTTDDEYQGGNSSRKSSASSTSSHERKRIGELRDTSFSGRIQKESPTELPPLSPREDRIKSRGSSASSASSVASSIASSINSASSRGRKRLANLRGEAIFSASGSVEFDPDKYAGVMRIDLQNRGRIKISSAVGANVAKYSAEIGENYQKHIPGRIILQESTKNSKGNIVHKYTALFLDGTKEVLDEVYLKSRMEVFTNSHLKPMIVEML